MKMVDTKADSQTQMLEPYYRDVRKTHPLSREEEQRLAVCIRKGDVEARNRLVTANLRFALDRAKRYQGRGVPLDELISAANRGLMDAAERFDGRVRFITYAAWWIRRSILKALSGAQHPFHVPGHIQDLQHKVHRAFRELHQELERVPTLDEVADYLETSVETVRLAVFSDQAPRSLEARSETASEAGHCLMDVLEDVNEKPAVDEQVEQVDTVCQMLGQLKQREAEVIRRYYGLNDDGENNLAEIGRKMGLSRERVRQIKAAAMKQLRTVFHN